MNITHEFANRQLSPVATPAVLVRGHAPFAWGTNAAAAVHHAVVLEAVAEMGWMTVGLNRHAEELPAAVRQKHFDRKHGADAYYGQTKPPNS